MHLVVLDARLEEMVAASQRDVVQQLRTRVVVRDREEERHAESIAIDEIHRDIRERARSTVHTVRAECRTARPIVRPGPILARILEAEFVREIGLQIGHETAIHRVGMVLLQPIGAARPGIDVERAVLLL